MLGGQFLVERAKVAGAPDSIAIVGLDRDGDAFTEYYFRRPQCASALSQATLRSVACKYRDAVAPGGVSVRDASP